MGDETHHFALPGEQDEVAGCVSDRDSSEQTESTTTTHFTGMVDGKVERKQVSGGRSKWQLGEFRVAVGPAELGLTDSGTGQHNTT